MTRKDDAVPAVSVTTTRAAHVQRFIAVDPGEVWCGIARLDAGPLLNPKNVCVGVQIRADARVLHIPSRGIYRTVTETLWALPATVVVEDYRVRPVGHARFHGGDTLRLIGALEMHTCGTRNSTFVTVAAGNADKELPQLTNGAFQDWETFWPQPHSKQWNHSRSAWRVLLRYLMQHEPTLLHYLREPALQATFKAHKATFPLAHPSPNDLLAPGALWEYKTPSFRRGLAPSPE